MIKYIIPRSINVEAIFSHCTERKKACVFLDLLVRIYQKQKLPSSMFVPITSYMLKEKLGNDYCRIIKKFIAANIIERNPKYSKGRFCMSYRFISSVKVEPLRIVEIEVKETLKDKSKICNAAQKYTLQCLEKVSIDQAAFDLITQNQTDIRKVLSNRTLLHLRNKKYDIRGGINQRRIYNVITECPKEVRACLTLNGEKLIEADIKSAQPLLLLSLYDDINCPEAIEYKKCLNQDFYFFFHASNRDQAKKQFLYFAFGDRMQKTKFSQKFQKYFPILYAKIREFNGSELALKLQNLESDIMNYNVLLQCKERQVFTITIHDGFLCKLDDFNCIKKMIIECVSSKLQVEPQIIIKNS